MNFKVYIIYLVLLSMIFLSGCGSKRNIPIETYPPISAGNINYKKQVRVNIKELANDMYRGHESIYNGLQDYLQHYAPYIVLSRYYTKNSDPSVLSLYIKTIRKGATIYADIDTVVILTDSKGNKISNSGVFVSQNCTNDTCEPNERYNMGLYSGKLLIEGIANQNNIYLSMFQKDIREEKTVKLRIKQKEDIETYENGADYQGLKNYTDKYPNSVYYIKSAELRLALTGPKGMKVGDIRKLIKDKRSENIIISLIKRVKVPYKEYTLDEIDKLINMGLSDNIIATMIDVTTKLLDNETLRKQQMYFISEQQKIASKKVSTAYTNAQYQKVNASGNPIVEAVKDEVVKQGVKMLLDQLF